MTKIFAAGFAVLTALSLFLTFNDVGVIDSSVAKPSVRQGSLHGGAHVGGIRRGK